MSNGLTSGFSDLSNSMGTWFSDLLENMVFSLINLGTSIGTFFDNLGTLMGTWFTNVVNALGNVTSTLITWFGNVIDSIVDGFKSIGTLIGYIWDFIVGLFDWIMGLVIPEKGFVETKNQQLVNELSNKFGGVTRAYNSFNEVRSRAYIDTYANGLSIPFIYGQVIDFTWYLPYRENVKTLISSCTYALTVFAFLKRIRAQVVLNG